MHDQPFLPRLAIRPLRHTHELETAKSQLFEFDMHLVDLPESAIDQQHIGRLDFTGLDTFVSPTERLAKRAVVVSGRDAGDVETAVLLLHGAFRAIDHARGHGALALRVADVETLQAPGCFIET